MLYLDWRFAPVFDLIDPKTAYTGTHNAGLVLLSVIVATLAAFVALSISGRIVVAVALAFVFFTSAAWAFAMVIGRRQGRVACQAGGAPHG